ncbi:MAG: phosphotransferase [Segniliparus sp.]|uniref:phosphotransferase n=1 Tax=Segniliparus sp. TaxID=2804064 RepID=UPI003F370614
MSGANQGSAVSGADPIGAANGQELPERIRAALRGVPLWSGRAIAAEPLAGGLTNDNWLVTDIAAEARYVMKVPGQGTEEYIDRATANRAARAAGEIGLTAEVHHFDAATGVEVAGFLDGHSTCTTAQLRDPGLGSEIMAVYRRLHQLPLLGKRATLFDLAQAQRDQLRAAGGAVPGPFRWLEDEFEDLKARFEASGFDLVPSHNDPMPGNFLLGPGGVKIIDFEYASDNDRSADLALLCTEAFIDNPSRELLDGYFGSPTPAEVARVQASQVAADFFWGVWGLLNARVKGSGFDYFKYGAWKLVRAQALVRMYDWDKVKAAV